MNPNSGMFATARELDELRTLQEYFDHRSDWLKLQWNIASSESGRPEEKSELLCDVDRFALEITDAINIAEATGARNVALPEFAFLPNEPLYFKLVDTKNQVISLMQNNDPADLVLIKFQYKNFAGLSSKSFQERLQALDGLSGALKDVLMALPSELKDKCHKAATMSVPSLRTAEVQLWMALSTRHLRIALSPTPTEPLGNGERIAILVRAGHLWFELGVWANRGLMPNLPPMRYVP